jgi:hypothetical protein
LALLFELASTSRIFAPGAIACAHSMSSAISSAQPESLRGVEVPPFWLTFAKQPFAVVHAGSPNCALKTERSLSAFGSSYASTIAIVWPKPAVELVENEYADLIVAGESPVGDVVAAGFPCASVTTSAWQWDAPSGDPGQTAAADALTFAAPTVPARSSETATADAAAAAAKYFCMCETPLDVACGSREHDACPQARQGVRRTS